MAKKAKEMVREAWVDLLSLYREEEDELDTKLEGVRKEIRHIKQEMEKLS